MCPAIGEPITPRPINAVFVVSISQLRDQRVNR